MKYLWISSGRAYGLLFDRSRPSNLHFVKILSIDRFSHMLFEKRSGFLSSLKSNNRTTRHSWSGKHGRFDDVIEQEKCLVEKDTFYLILNHTVHY